jgi:NAD(P)H dehydrogenase (quinone)
MKIGVTGATGQLGRIIIEKLKEKTLADTILALVRSTQKASDLGVEAREFDYDQPGLLAGALKGIDKLLLISGNEVGKRFPQHANVIEAAKKAGVKLIAYTSLLRADTSTIGLAPEHLETEKAILRSGIPSILLRHGWYTENYTASLANVVSGGVLYGASGNGRISSAARTDYAEADVVALTTAGNEGRIFELAGDEPFTMSDLAKVISQVSGKDIQYKNLSVAEFTAILVKSGLPEGAAQFYAGVHVSTEKGDLFDNDHQLSRLIGRPTTPLSEVIKKALSKAK